MLLVTGATGFIGRHVVRSLVREGYAIRVFSQNPARAKALFGADVEIIGGSFSNRAALQRALRGVRTVVHLAGRIALVPEDAVGRDNLRSTTSLLAACRRVDRFVYSSSITAYGPLARLADEERPCAPIDLYGQSKLQAEQAILRSGIPHEILRIAIVYGLGSGWWDCAFRFMRFGFIPRTDAVSHLIHTSDVSRAVLLALKARRLNRTYNIAEPRAVPLQRVFEEVARLFGRTPLPVPLPLAKLATSVLGGRDGLGLVLVPRRLDVSRAKRELQFEARADRNAKLREMVEAYWKSRQAAPTRPAPSAGR